MPRPSRHRRNAALCRARSVGRGEALAQALDLEALSARYREALAAGKEAPSAIFDALRRAQGGRRDFTLTPIARRGRLAPCWQRRA